MGLTNRIMGAQRDATPAPGQRHARTECCRTPRGIVRSVARTVMLSLLFAAVEPARGEDGRALLERHCGRCHAVSESAQSRPTSATNLWVILRSYEQEQLEFELSEGIGSRHSKMPQIQFSSEEISNIQEFLFGPAQRAR